MQIVITANMFEMLYVCICSLHHRTAFDLPRQQWSLLNLFRMEQGHCGAWRRKWQFTDTDLCPCGETQDDVPHC